MKIGLNSMVFCNCYTDEYLTRVDLAADLGYDLIEIVVGDAAFDVKKLKRKLLDRGLLVQASCTIQSNRALSSLEPDTRKRGQVFFDRCYHIMEDLGAVTLSGPLFVSGEPPTPQSAQERCEEWRITVDSLGEAARNAEKRGLTLCIEPLNRYKTSLINRAEQGIQMVDEIGLSNIKLLYDTYHANMEEKSIAGAIQNMGLRYLGEIHVCDNDKGAPGSGHIDFPAVAQALRQIQYDGAVIFESFLPCDKDNIWTPLGLTQEVLAADALRYLRQIF